MRNMSLPWCWEREDVLSEQLSDVCPDRVTSPDWHSLSPGLWPGLCSQCHLSRVIMASHHRSEAPAPDYQTRDLFELLFISAPPWAPRDTDHLTRAHCAVPVLWRCHTESDGLFTTMTHAVSLPELSTNNWAAKYFSRACWEMKCCKEMHPNRCVVGEAGIMKRAFLEHLHLHSKQSYLPK